MQLSFLDTPIEFSKGVGPARSELFRKELGIFTFDDLLRYYPFRYVDRTKFQKISEVDGESGYVQIIGRTRIVSQVGIGKSSRLVASFFDGTGEIDLVWFNASKWLKEKLSTHVEFVVYGKPTYFNGTINITHPEIEQAEKLILADRISYLAPFYSSTEKLKSKGLD
ncbi:MAG: ATP-dependent DNA helicase RecG, partial [Bacteroidota bacterium]